MYTLPSHEIITEVRALEKKQPFAGKCYPDMRVILSLDGAKLGRTVLYYEDIDLIVLYVKNIFGGCPYT